MRPQVGREYRLDINGDALEEPISWVSNKKSPRYMSWGEIDGKIVLVKSVSKINIANCLVALTELPGFNFYVPKKFLMNITARLPVQCKCDFGLLVAQGCKCGAIEKERKRK